MSVAGTQTLKKTLNNEGFEGSLKNFKQFLREIKDGNDEPDDPQGDCELKLQFIFDLKKVDLKNLETKYFANDSLILVDNTLRMDLKEKLKNPDSDVKDLLIQAEELGIFLNKKSSYQYKYIHNNNFCQIFFIWLFKQKSLYEKCLNLNLNFEAKIVANLIFRIIFI